MEGNDRAKDAPSLEPPSLFGRKRRRRERSEPAAPVETGAPVEDPAEAPAFAQEVPVEEDPSSVAAAEEPLATAPPARPRVRRVRRERPARAARTPRPARTPRAARSPRAPRRITGVSGLVAACLTGLVVGLGTVLLTWASQGVCELATGTSSCGDPGFVLLVAVLIAMTLLGSAMLRLFGVADAGSTSFLAVGVLTVLILVFLVDALFSWTMIVVVPLLAVGSYALSHAVTTAVAEPD